MKTLLNKFNKIGVLAVLFAALVITTQSAFKAVGKLDPPANGWYTVTIPSGDPAVESNQVIGSLTTAPPETDENGCARTENSGNVCRVELTFDGSATTVPANVAAAKAPGSHTSVDDTAESPED
ncbi:MAG TPA: hypothetical protein VK541_23365 [Pedobacter sp.]|uniref:hypothetical protein n=1 Tax=Pedobacter sp. TaxID=1411316 RepID=UPI002BBBFFFD|nr:hypothetical protein [Pedobacter sp.]HMI05447.1 hypothetical protein [Pedobacter sp.]